MQLVTKLLVIIFLFSFWTLSSQDIDSSILKDSLSIKQKQKSTEIRKNKLRDSVFKVNLNKKIYENGGAMGFFFYSLSSKLDSLLNVRDSLLLVQKRLRIIAQKPMKKIEDVTIQDYKIFYSDGSEELYDHKTDSYEWKNLASKKKYKTVKQNLSEWLPKKWAESALSKNAFRFDPDSYSWINKKTGKRYFGSNSDN